MYGIRSSASLRKLSTYTWNGIIKAAVGASQGHSYPRFSMYGITTASDAHWANFPIPPTTGRGTPVPADINLIPHSANGTVATPGSSMASAPYPNVTSVISGR